MNPHPPKARFPFTKTALAKLSPPATGRAYAYDTQAPGLAIAITHRGSAAFYWIGRLAGQSRRIKIGDWPKTTIQQARRAAKRIAGEGQQPGADLRRAARDEPTLGRLWEWYLAHHARPNKRSWPRDIATWTKDLKRWTNRRLSAIRPADIVTAAQQIHDARGPGAANKFLDLLRSMFGKARHPLRWTTDSPCAGIPKYKIEARRRFLLASEIPRFFAALDTLRQTPRDFFALALLTGARRANLAAMRWDEVDLAARVWTIPAAKAKGKRPITVILTPEAMAILERRKNASQWVFPGNGKAGHYCEPKDAWRRLCERAGLTDLRIHDLRRTLASWQIMAGTSSKIVGESLGHKSLEATAAYAHLQTDTVRAAVEQAAAAITAHKNKFSSK